MQLSIFGDCAAESFESIQLVQRLAVHCDVNGDAFSTANHLLALFVAYFNAISIGSVRQSVGEILEHLVVSSKKLYNYCSPLVVPVTRGEIGNCYCHLFFVFRLLTFLSLRSLSPLTNSFYLLLLFSILLPLFTDIS